MTKATLLMFFQCCESSPSHTHTHTHIHTRRHAPTHAHTHVHTSVHSSAAFCTNNASDSSSCHCTILVHNRCGLLLGCFIKFGSHAPPHYWPSSIWAKETALVFVAAFDPTHDLIGRSPSSRAPPELHWLVSWTLFLFVNSFFRELSMSIHVLVLSESNMTNI